MKNFSDINLSTSKEQTISVFCSLSGLSENSATKLYENQKFLGKSDDEIINMFKPTNVNQEMFSSDEYLDEMNKLILSLGLNDNSSDDDKHKFTIDFVNMLDTFVHENKIDSVNLLDIVTKIMIIKNPKNTDKYIGNLIIEDKSNIGLSKLNESFEFTPLVNMVSSNLNNNNNVQLFEGLKHILTKNNKRWGHNYHLVNVYETIMRELTNEVETMLLKDKIVSVDTTFNLTLINEMLTGNVNPMYKDYSSVKHLITDTQVVMFDMMLLVNKYFIGNESALKFVNSQTYADYKTNASNLISMIISSFKDSTLFNNEEKDKWYNEGKITSDGFKNYDLLNNDLLINKLTESISNQKYQRHQFYQIHLKAVVDMLKFIQSISVDYNLKIRPAIRMYINKGFELASSVERANMLFNKTR